MDSQEPVDATHTPQSSRFETETAVMSLGEGRYRATLYRSWWIIAGPNGGYIAALLCRAVVAEVGDPSRRPRSLSIQYLSPPSEGNVDIDVTVERSGRSVSNLTARMTQNNKLIAIAMAVVAVERESPVGFDETGGLGAVIDLADLPRPDQVVVGEVDPDRVVPMRDHYDIRWVTGDLPFTHSDNPDRRARCGGWLRPAEPVAIDEVVLAAMSDAWLPPVFSKVEVPIAVPTIDLTIHFRDLPADPLDYCFVIFESPLAAHGYTVEHGQIFSSDGKLLLESRQLAVLA